MALRGTKIELMQYKQILLKGIKIETSAPVVGYMRRSKN